MASRSIAHFFVAALMRAAVVSSSAVVTNPTGTCQPKDNAKDNGARPKYHSPGASTYLPDCDAPLNREYWRVFAKSESSAYVIPRIDAFGVAAKYGMCTGDDELSSLFKKYRLCKETLDSADVEVLNNMKPSEALNITHALHKRLCFQAQATSPSFQALQITPWGPDDDIMDLCKTTTDAAAASYCDEIKKSFECTGSCVDMAIMPSAEVVKVIVPGLNKLYGAQCPGFGFMSTARSQSDDGLTSLLSVGVLVLLHGMPLHF